MEIKSSKRYTVGDIHISESKNIKDMLLKIGVTYNTLPIAEPQNCCLLERFPWSLSKLIIAFFIYFPQSIDLILELNFPKSKASRTWKTEVLCYEFKGTINDKTVLVYINAETGKEENIFILVDDINGMLTI